LVAIKLNSEREGRELAAKLGVRGLPTVVFLDADGNEWDRLSGFAPAPAFTQRLQRVLKAFQDLPISEAKLRANPKDLALAARFAAQVATMGNQPKALWAIGLIEKQNPKGPYAVAYSAVGGMLLDANKSKEALSWFTKALAVAKSGDEIAGARMGIGFCYATQQDFKRARVELTAATKTPGISADLKDRLTQVLTRMP
jgi:tetratricopeptide (TPR) repeat protein